MKEFKLVIKEGWLLQKDAKTLGNILKAILRNNNCCPCQKNHPKCPCSSYINDDTCCCKLYQESKPKVQGNETL